MELKNDLSYLNPSFVVGLTDAEASFCVIITKDVSRPLGFVISISFEIGLNKKVVEIIENKDHLTEKGINDIRVIKENMNTGRLDD